MPSSSCHIGITHPFRLMCRWKRPTQSFTSEFRHCKIDRNTEIGRIVLIIRMLVKKEDGPGCHTLGGSVLDSLHGLEEAGLAAGDFGRLPCERTLGLTEYFVSYNAEHPTNPPQPHTSGLWGGQGGAVIVDRFGKGESQRLRQLRGSADPLRMKGNDSLIWDRFCLGSGVRFTATIHTEPAGAPMSLHPLR